MAVCTSVLLLLALVTTVTCHWKCEPCTCIVKNDVQYIDCQNLDHVRLPVPVNFSESLQTSLYIVNNDMPFVHDDLFANFTKINVVFLRLRNNSIKHISRDVFRNLPHLRGLDLSWNKIDIKQVTEALSAINNPQFTNLNISHMQIRYLPDDIFNPFVTAKYINISIHHNELNTFNWKALGILPGINLLDLSSNYISGFGFHSSFHCSAKVLKLDNNKFNFFPYFCYKEDAVFPRLEILRFQWNFMRGLNSSHIRCLHKLRQLHLNGNIFSTLKRNTFSDLISIQDITLSETFALQYIDAFPFNNSGLQRVYFRKNFLYTENLKHTLNLFEGCTNMTLLNMAGNILDKTSDAQFEALFKPLTNLKILIMGDCRLTRIPPAITKYLLNLRELALYNNRIASWPDGSLNSLIYLDTIYMRENELTVITEEMLPVNFTRKAWKVDFTYNPFQCSCDNRWFAELIEYHPKVFAIPDYSYECITPPEYKNQNLTSFPMSDSICLLDLNSKIITLTLSTLLILLIVFGTLGFHFRWQIRYMIYMMRYHEREVVDPGNYTYDVFVAYSDKDRPWVKEQLMPALEKQSSLKLCIHNRDFEVGRLIVDNIVGCVEQSRCLLIVLSNEFLRSNWCRFELNLIQRHVIEHRRCVLVLALLEDLDTSHVTKSVSAMMSTTTYLAWGQDQSTRKAFFNQLRVWFRKPTTKVRSRRLSV